MWKDTEHTQLEAVAPLAGSVDRNDQPISPATGRTPSLPSRGAWIEITGKTGRSTRKKVAPLAGSVDRNNVAEEAKKSASGRSPRGERG